MAEETHISPMQRADTPAVARAHAAAFPDYFLTHLGDGFLQLFYAEFVDNPAHPGFVAKVDGRVVGFVVGTLQPEALYKDFYRRNFVRLIGIVAERVATDAYVRHHISARMQHVLLAARSYVLRNDAPAQASGEDHGGAHLLSIGLLPDARGLGIGEGLMSVFERRVQADGAHKVLLSVRADNPRAIAFYQKCGWRKERMSEASIVFAKDLGAP